jgi:hypothetical protein
LLIETRYLQQCVIDLVHPVAAAAAAAAAAALLRTASSNVTNLVAVCQAVAAAQVVVLDRIKAIQDSGFNCNSS